MSLCFYEIAAGRADHTDAARLLSDLDGQLNAGDAGYQLSSAAIRRFRASPFLPIQLLSEGRS